MKNTHKKLGIAAYLALLMASCYLLPTAIDAAPPSVFAQGPASELAMRPDYPLFQRSLEGEIKKIFSGKGYKDPAVSVALAAVPPLLSIQGLGQVYNGELGKGLLFFGFAQVSLGTYFTAVDNKTANIAFGAYMASWVWSTIDAYRSAKRINAKRGYGKVTPRGSVYSHSNYHRSLP